MDEETNSSIKDSKKVRKRSRVFRFLRNILIGFVIVLILLLIAGVAYTWYTGQNVKVKDDVAPVKTSQPTTTQPSQLATNAKEGVAIQGISSPVSPGSNATVTIETNRDSVCSITVVYNNVPSKDSGLTPKTADEYGTATWSWTVGSTVPVGTWPVTISCVWNKKSAIVIGNLVVAK
ncbi:MAG TPA: hypothetical protein VMR16_02145 [Candidatus Saccharimonadales bacterium]|nr:hypothetical protein [Candidatus Saccharimonadales bacterium]